MYIYKKNMAKEENFQKIIIIKWLTFIRENKKKTRPKERERERERETMTNTIQNFEFHKNWSIYIL